MPLNPVKILAVTGPTATGKTALAIALAQRFNGEIVSVDSRQVYRHMDLGTGKDLAEYTTPSGRVPAHLLDLCEPTDSYNLVEFYRDATRAIAEIAQRGKLPILCGGTALYLDALLRGYQFPGQAPDPRERAELDAMSEAELRQALAREYPEVYATFADRDNHTRLRRALEIARHGGPTLEKTEIPQYHALVLGVYFPRREVRERIAQRLDARLAAGMIDEVRMLHEQRGVSWEKLEFFGLEYRYIARYLQGLLTREAMRELLLNQIRQFAKRQDIFFRKMEREGRDIYWLPQGDRPQAETLVKTFLADQPLPEPALRLHLIDYGKPEHAGA